MKYQSAQSIDLLYMIDVAAANEKSIYFFDFFDFFDQYGCDTWIVVQAYHR
jgi:hypothetical protein